MVGKMLTVCSLFRSLPPVLIIIGLTNNLRETARVSFKDDSKEMDGPLAIAIAKRILACSPLTGAEYFAACGDRKTRHSSCFGTPLPPTATRLRKTLCGPEASSPRTAAPRKNKLNRQCSRISLPQAAFRAAPLICSPPLPRLGTRLIGCGDLRVNVVEGFVYATFLSGLYFFFSVFVSLCMAMKVCLFVIFALIPLVLTWAPVGGGHRRLRVE